MCHSQNIKTEDDTFAALRRTPAEQMRLVVREMNREKKSPAQLRVELKKHGWTVLEYQDALAALLNRQAT